VSPEEEDRAVNRAWATCGGWWSEPDPKGLLELCESDRCAHVTKWRDGGTGRPCCSAACAERLGFIDPGFVRMMRLSWGGDPLLGGHA